MTPHHVHEQNIYSTSYEWCWIVNACLWATFICVCGGGEVDGTVWMNLINSLLQNDLQYERIARPKDIERCPPCPNKRQSKKLLPLNKSRNGDDRENSYTIEDITECGQKSVRFEYRTLSKSRDKYVWCSIMKEKKAEYWTVPVISKPPRLPWSLA